MKSSHAQALKVGLLAGVVAYGVFFLASLAIERAHPYPSDPHLAEVAHFSRLIDEKIANLVVLGLAGLAVGACYRKETGPLLLAAGTAAAAYQAVGVSVVLLRWGLIYYRQYHSLASSVVASLAICCLMALTADFLVRTAKRETPPPSRSRRWLGWIGVGIVLLPLFIILLYLEEDWRGGREWNHALARLEAAQETVDLQKLLPAPVPDEQNVAAAPIFAELFAAGGTESRLASLKIYGKDHAKTPRFNPLNEGHPDWPAWQAVLTDQKDPATAEQDVLRFLQSKGDVLRDLREALARPAAVWPVTGPSLVTVKMPQVKIGLNAVQFLALRAAAEIDLQQSDRAFDDLLLMFRFSETVGEGRFLIAYLVSGAMDFYAFDVLRQGIEKSAWSDAQIAEIEKILQARDPFGQAREALRLERASGLRLTTFPTGYFDAMAGSEKDSSTADTIAAGYQSLPQGWLKADRACIAEALQDAIEEIDPTSQTIRFEKVRDVERRIAQTKPPRAIHFDPRRFFSRLVLPAMADIPPKAAQFQAHLNEATLACAIELFRRENGHLPETLDELKPRFLASIPGDPIGGPMHYRRTPDGRDYILYSVGWDRKDDGGSVDAKHFKTGDWSWASRADLYRLAPN